MIAAESPLIDQLPCVAPECIEIRGARTHNLKNVDLDIPRGKLVVITGPSGSGKSSLAFDTLFAEGQRQFIESLSTFARQFLDQLERPDVDSITGLAPAVCIDQRPGRVNPRSTVATSTEIHDFLRLLYARAGDVACHRCGDQVRQQSEQQIQDELLALPEGTRLMLLAPLVRARKGQHAEVIEQIRRSGQVRARVDGIIFDLDAVPPLDGRKPHSIDAVVDRIVVRGGSASRLAESLHLAVKQSGGVVIASYQSPAIGTAAQPLEWTDRLFSTLHACPTCGTSLAEVEPRTFSFNSPYGACATCEGLGSRVEFDPELTIPDPTKSLATGAIAPWENLDTQTRGRQTRGRPQPAAVAPARDQVSRFLVSQGLNDDVPVNDFPASLREQLLRGDGEDFPGLQLLLAQELATATDSKRLEQLESYRGKVVCPDCQGARLRPEARSVYFCDKNITQFSAMSLAEASEFLKGIVETQTAGEGSDSGDKWAIARPLVQEIRKRLDFLCRVGLGYLTLDRASDSLSGGELQRIRLATGIASGLAGILYILDEPSIGLHSRDNERLIGALRNLTANESTVVVVEHDEAVMRAADWLIDIGPGAGRHGGEVVATGTPVEVQQNSRSLTGRYLAGRERIALPSGRRATRPGQALVLAGVTANNLQIVTATFPLGLLIGVSGVSGSGKSSLINETLAPALIRRLGGAASKPGEHLALHGTQLIDKVIQVDQSPLGRSPRSNPATYTGVFDEVRKVYAATKAAKQLGFKASRFSFNVAGGRCEECQGQGIKRLEMKFLPDLFVRCPVCEGKRFNPQTLAVRYKDLTIADVLDMSITSAAAFFENFPAIVRVLASLSDVGLGYLSLGQQATTLSGGESQRIKLATELAHSATGRTLFLLDEPTTGLHFDDIRQLLAVLQRLCDRGNTVIVVEHSLDVLKCCDHLIDLGPGGGREGGQIVACGTPEEVASSDRSETGSFLRGLLA